MKDGVRGVLEDISKIAIETTKESIRVLQKVIESERSFVSTPQDQSKNNNKV